MEFGALHIYVRANRPSLVCVQYAVKYWHTKIYIYIYTCMYIFVHCCLQEDALTEDYTNSPLHRFKVNCLTNSDMS